MEINAKTEHWIETGTAVGTGVLAWEYEATKKYSQQVGYQGLFSKGRFEDALSGFVGSDTVRKIDPILHWTRKSPIQSVWSNQQNKPLRHSQSL